MICFLFAFGDRRERHIEIRLENEHLVLIEGISEIMESIDGKIPKSFPTQFSNDD